MSNLVKQLAKANRPAPYKQGWLYDYLDDMNQRGIPFGKHTPASFDELETILANDDLVAEVERVLARQGVTGGAGYGQYGLPARGVEKATFATPDGREVFKIGAGEAQDLSMPLGKLQGVFGVAREPMNRVIMMPIRGRTFDDQADTARVIVQERGIKNHPRFGDINDPKTLRTMNEAFRRQGFGVKDALHENTGNQMFRQSNEFEPVVTDGKVFPLLNPTPKYRVPFPFIRPTAPGTPYSVLPAAGILGGLNDE